LNPPTRRPFSRLGTALALLLAAPSRTPAAAEPLRVQGRAGTADARAVVDFSRLARQAAAAPAPAREPFYVPPPLPTPEPGAAEPSAGRVPGAPFRPAPPPAPPPASPAVSAGFSGLDDNLTSIPPDTHGSVGPNHLLVTLNSQVRVQNKSGGALSTVTLAAFWAATGAVTPFDPKSYYDAVGGRFIFTAVAERTSASSAILIGVSQTADPTGAWNLYRIDADAADLTWADYPSLGYNKDWIVVSANMFTNAANTFDRSRLWVFSKANLYAGGAGSFTLLQDTSGGSTQVPAATHDASLSTLYLLEHWNGASGQLRLSAITGAVGSETLTLDLSRPTAALTWDFTPPTDNFAPQSGSSTGVMVNDSRVQSVVYRNGSLWTCQTVMLPAGAPTRSAAQWWQIDPSNGSVRQFGRVDDPAGAVFYAFPSLAVNSRDDVLLGYSRFSAAAFPSAAYSVRYGTDPSGTLRADTLLKSGEAAYEKDFGTGRNRWGDYSAASVDPSDDLSLWTLQEYAMTLSGGTSRWGTWWGKIPGSSVDLSVSVSAGAAVVTPGETVTFTASVRNDGPDAAAQVTLTDTPPAGASLVSASASQGSCSGTVCSLGALAAGASATASFVVSLSRPGANVDRVRVSADEFDPDAADNSASATAVLDASGRIYPVPWKPGSGGAFDSASAGACGRGVVFDRFLDGTHVRIRTPQGELVRELFIDAAAGGCRAWDGRNESGADAASGVYIAVIHPPEGDDAVRRIAVER
jgi:uncharacterized repeat protein (TIGR01451 family)